MTQTEVALWNVLKGKQVGYKFRRQHPLGEYILDFYCPALRLAIEVDGSAHHGRETHDRAKDAFVATQGILMVRVWNAEVRDFWGDAVGRILKAVEDRRVELGIEPY